GDETFRVVLSNPVGATLGQAEAVVTIHDDDAMPSLSISDASVTEGNSGTTPVQLTVTLSAASGRAVTFSWATADGTAKAVSDYQAASSTVTIPAGSLTAPITVNVLGDTIVEPDETFQVVLSNPTGASIGRGQAVVTIQNDDHDDIKITIDDVRV